MKRLALALAVVLLSTSASAESMWEKAKQPTKPGMLPPDDVHKIFARLYHAARTTRATDPIFGGQTIAAMGGALDILERHQAGKSSDPRLRFDLGLVLANLKRCDRATVVLEDALAFAPAHPFVEDAAFELAICYSRLGKHDLEERAYLKVLDATDRRTHKAVVWSNLAESRMARGDLTGGIDAAEAAIDLEGDFPSARYNLAILRDRDGDAFGALEAAKHAVELDPEAEYLDGEGVFFEPPYERSWYYALRELALAERTLGDERKAHLLGALMHYRKWLDAADASDRFRPRALENIARLEKQLKLKK